MLAQCHRMLIFVLLVAAVAFGSLFMLWYMELNDTQWHNIKGFFCVVIVLSGAIPAAISYLLVAAWSIARVVKPYIVRVITTHPMVLVLSVLVCILILDNEKYKPEFYTSTKAHISTLASNIRTLVNNNPQGVTLLTAALPYVVVREMFLAGWRWAQAPAPAVVRAPVASLVPAGAISLAHKPPPPPSSHSAYFSAPDSMAKGSEGSGVSHDPDLITLTDTSSSSRVLAGSAPQPRPDPARDEISPSDSVSSAPHALLEDIRWPVSRYLCEESGKIYFYNEDTGETWWDVPHRRPLHYNNMVPPDKEPARSVVSVNSHESF